MKSVHHFVLLQPTRVTLVIINVVIKDLYIKYGYLLIPLKDPVELRMLDGAAEDEEPIKQSDVLVKDPEEIKKHAKKLEKIFFVKILKQELERGLKQGKLLIILPEESKLYVIKLPWRIRSLWPSLLLRIWKIWRQKS